MATVMETGVVRSADLSRTTPSVTLTATVTMVLSL